ncbi:maleylpyruvate isomerase family mycothiol-dependent enzyme [Salinactinospora qingdaonensis]|uniref:Maleylpyruvate isomerase family mycothiol-dependent enzyme n=1 Tax=Salinactinospora qingdaonensis TaxID=702744 RepID=A0ABP7FDA1_9ACTN
MPKTPPPDQCHRLSHETYVDALAAETRRMAATVAGADLTATVPTCPEWDLGKLVRHVSRVHRWVNTLVKHGITEPTPRSELPRPAAPERAEDYPAWLTSGAEELATVLRAADPNAPVWNWSTDHYVRFWSRRMLHETIVHRVDAELTVGIKPAVEPWWAVDTIDELFSNLAAARFGDTRRQFQGDGSVLALAATDVDVHWRVHLHARDFTLGHAAPDAPATSTLAGPAGELALTVSRRRPLEPSARGCTLTGERAPWDSWLSTLAF